MSLSYMEFTEEQMKALKKRHSFVSRFRRTKGPANGGGSLVNSPSMTSVNGSAASTPAAAAPSSAAATPASAAATPASAADTPASPTSPSSSSLIVNDV